MADSSWPAAQTSPITKDPPLRLNAIYFIPALKSVHVSVGLFFRAPLM